MAGQERLDELVEGLSQGADLARDLRPAGRVAVAHFSVGPDEVELDKWLRGLDGLGFLDLPDKEGKITPFIVMGGNLARGILVAAKVVKTVGGTDTAAV